MAHAAGDTHEFPIYGAHFRVTFPILDADGDLVSGAASLDSEVSKDSGTFADCTHEATEIATSSGMYYLDLTGAEMEAKKLAVIVKTATAGAKTTPITLYPRRMHVMETGTAQAGAAGTITLASGASADDDFYNGMYVVITNNSPAGVDNQARRVIDYVGSTKVATLDSNWGTNPSSATTYEIQAENKVDVAMWAGARVVDVATAGVPHINLAQWLGAAPDALSSGKIPADLKLWLATAPLALISQLVQSQANQLGATAKSDVNAEVDGALDTAIPGSPTADSVNERLKRLEEDVTTARAGNLDNLDAQVSTRTAPADSQTINMAQTTPITPTADTVGEALRFAHQGLPNAGPGTNGGLGTVDANNRIAGIQGTKNTLDALNDLSAGQVNTEVDGALNTAIPGSPTADSVNERLKRLEEDVTPARATNLDNLDAAVTTRSTFNSGTDNVTVGAIVADAINAASLAADAANEIADALLKRDIDQVEASAALHSLGTAVLKSVSRIRNNAGTLEVFRTDGITVHMKQTVTTDPANEPVDELAAGLSGP